MKRSVRITFVVLIVAMAAAVLALRTRNGERESRLQAPTTGTTP